MAWSDRMQGSARLQLNRDGAPDEGQDRTRQTGGIGIRTWLVTTKEPNLTTSWVSGIVPRVRCADFDYDYYDSVATSAGPTQSSRTRPSCRWTAKSVSRSEGGRRRASVPVRNTRKFPGVCEELHSTAIPALALARLALGHGIV